MAVVSVEELLEFMSDVNLTSGQTFSAELILDGVQSELETWLGRPVEVDAADRVEIAHVNDQGELILSHTPIVSITSITHPSGGSALAYNLDGGRLTLLSVPYGPVQVAYRGGIDGSSIPAIRLGILRVAAREMTSRHDDTYTVKDLSADEPPRPVIGWQPEELAILSRYRRRTVAVAAGPYDDYQWWRSWR